jgi:hypothetical protein
MREMYESKKWNRFEGVLRTYMVCARCVQVVWEFYKSVLQSEVSEVKQGIMKSKERGVHKGGQV